MHVVLLDSFAADQGADVWDELRLLGTVTTHPRTPPELVLPRAADADALVTNKVVLGADALAALPRLRYVGVSATGTNVVDLAEAAARQIAVTNVPGYSSDSVAQLVFAALLHLTTDVAGHDRAVKGGRWADSPDFCFFLRPLVELSGKTLVVVGLGAIGKTVARIAESFGMRVIAAQVPGSTSPGRTPLAEALPEADVVTLHCPLVPRTERLVDAAFLARLKPSAVLINTSRGGLVDEGAPLEALEQGRLAGAALDVLGQEPPPRDHPLISAGANAGASLASRLVVTPHVGWGTTEARGRLRREVAENLKAFQRGLRRNRVV